MKRFVFTDKGDGTYGGSNPLDVNNIKKIYDDSAGGTGSPDNHNHDDRYYTESEADSRFEPTFSKNSAFNKNFSGSGAATTVSRSDHDHGKELKEITSSTYTIIYTDIFKWLKFTADNCTVTIPQDILSAVGTPIRKGELEGQFDGSGTLTFVAGTGMTIKKPNDLQAAIPQYGVFGFKWDALASGTLFGTLIPV